MSDAVERVDVNEFLSRLIIAGLLRSPKVFSALPEGVDIPLPIGVSKTDRVGCITVEQTGFNALAGPVSEFPESDVIVDLRGDPSRTECGFFYYGRTLQELGTTRLTAVIDPWLTVAECDARRERLRKLEDFLATRYLKLLPLPTRPALLLIAYDSDDRLQAVRSWHEQLYKKRK